MDFSVELYESGNGASPVRQFLDELRVSDPNDFAAVLAGLVKLRNSQYHREPLSKPLGEGLFEMRHVGKLNVRVLWFFMKVRRIVAVHGIRNKGQAIPARDLETARERMLDWQRRMARLKKPILTNILTHSFVIRLLPHDLRTLVRLGTCRCK